MRRGLGVLIAVLALVIALPVGSAFAAAQEAGDGSAQAAKKKGKKKKKKKKSAKVKRTVCKKGCKFRTIQKAVKASNKNDVIKVKPGTYVEGVIVKGHKYDGLKIVGTGKSPKAVVLEGENAKTKNGLAQNGVDAENVNNIKILNLTVQNYAANGILVHGETDVCKNYLLKDLIAAYNRAYGLFAFDCIGGRMTESLAYGHGDSGFYVGQTRPQSQPVTTRLDNLESHTNVVGYSGTNSKYQVIENSDFYNNGIGLVPNTLDSEKFEPTADSVIRNNNIFWNNFNYYLPASPVQTISNGLGELGGNTINFPIGIGIVMLGADGWTVENNNIFGNFLWGVATMSSPSFLNEGDDAINQDNRIVNNSFGRGGTDTNQFDLFNDGSGTGTCFSGNGTVSEHDEGADTPTLYPACPAPGVGSGTSSGDGDQFGYLLGLVASDPPSDQQCFWSEHPHPAFESYQPLTVPGGPTAC